jgi:hypothetical protein
MCPIAIWQVQEPHEEWDTGGSALAGANNYAASCVTGGVADFSGVFLWPPIPQIHGVVFHILMQRLIEAINLLGVTSFKTIKQLVDKVMNLNDGLITEPGQSDAGTLIVPIVVAGVGIGFIHCSSATACCSNSSGK